MKKIIFVFVALLTAASLHSCQDDIYTDEFSRYESLVKKHSKEFEQTRIDSIQNMINVFWEESKHLSCVYCVAEGLLDGEILDYCRNDHRALLFIADRHFKGEYGPFKFTFQTMFKEFYPEEYDMLLIEASIPKAIEWRDMVNEYQIPLENLFDRFIELEFEND